MTTIDFMQLLRDAKQQKKTVSQTSTTSSTHDKQASRGSQETFDPNSKGHNNPSARIESRQNDDNSSPFTSDCTVPPRSLEFDYLQLQKICKHPSSIYYSSQCLFDPNPIWKWLETLPSGDSGQGEWKTMLYGKRRVCMVDGKSTRLPEPLWQIAQQLHQVGIFREEPPNHVLLNEYEAGQGILHHTDGPSYESRTATLSLGSDVLLEFSKRLKPEEIGNHPEEEKTLPVVLEAGSLIVFEDDAYLNYCHGIAFREEDITDESCLNARPGRKIPRGKRYSLTFRRKREEQ